jgi:hypothetical protein
VAEDKASSAMASVTSLLLHLASLWCNFEAREILEVYILRGIAGGVRGTATHREERPRGFIVSPPYIGQHFTGVKLHDKRSAQ